MLQKALRVRATVHPGGRIEVHAPDVAPGETVEVIILLPETRPTTKRSAVDILAAVGTARAFTTGDEVDRHLQTERDAWDN